ncbi:MAG TPA: hybrid sensor histidine kinase/response regulator [Verrucomicrobiae bacterium]|nr:hybrid sensor histidine kinase/response regulator [Verrucomicrobiae bacterium]
MSVADSSPRPVDILVVDDTQANLQLLTGMLKERGYKVRPALNGELALQAARRSAPDLILLDINMPGLSGYEVAARLKQDEKLRGVPILFLSALTETGDKVRAFEAGGVDYVVKPFQFEEVAARVETHLKLRRLQVELADRNRELQQRNQELHDLQQLRDNLVHMIVHDLRSPLSVMTGYLDLYEMTEKASISGEGAKHLQQVHASIRRLLEMVNSLLDVNKMEAGELRLCPGACDLEAMGREVLGGFESLRRARRFEIETPGQPVVLAADRDLLVRVMQNLVGNALKHAPDGTAIRFSVETRDGVARVSVSDSGMGIAPEHHARIFRKFGQVETGGPRAGTGLGLTFCKLAVEAHGGRIGVESDLGKGSTFWFEIPTRGPVTPPS